MAFFAEGVEEIKVRKIFSRKYWRAPPTVKVGVSMGDCGFESHLRVKWLK